MLTLAARATIFLERGVIDEELMSLWVRLPRFQLPDCGKLFLERGIGHAIASGLLGRVERLVRGRHDLVAGSAMNRIVGYATAYGHGPGHAGKMMKFNLAAQLLCYTKRVFAGSFRRHDGELVAAVTAHHVHFTELLFENRG